MAAAVLTLANGLRCHLIHQPAAQRAAALVQVRAGSLDEPPRWPGLAHLLEHLLFCGSARFSGPRRLMPWVQQQGGQVNATTQLSRSAYFFELPAAALGEGLTRLADLLAAPQLSREAIVQEQAVIDAEYRLLQHHAETLCEAALLDALGGAFRRFRVGSASAFGDNVTECQAALRHFHQRHYRAAAMTLWISGPQSLTALTQLAHDFAAAIAPGEAHEPPLMDAPTAPAASVLRLAGQEQFWLGLPLSGEATRLRDNVTLLRAFWQDDAPGGLMARLRAEQLCDAIQVQWLWQAGRQSVLVLRFSAPHLTARQAQRIEQRFWQHLTAVSQAPAHQHRHYLQLAQQDFQALAPLAQLRGRALDFAPPESVPAAFSAFAAALAPAGALRLLTQQQAAAAACCTQGFTLQRASWPPLSPPVLAPVPWTFYPQPATPVTQPPAVSGGAAPLLQIAARQPQETLLLRPACGQTLTDEAAQARSVALRPLLARLRHLGGQGYWEQQQGNWQLALHLSAAALPLLPALLHALQTPGEAATAAVPASIAIRQLLAALPQQLRAPAPLLCWQAVWCGSAALHRQVAQALHAFPLSAVASAAPPLQRGITALPCTGGDAALLLFMPLPQQDDLSLAALRALALMTEPRFFQRLRVEQPVGYVVSARYQRVADVDGLLLALQSPDVGWRELLSHCKRFLRDMQPAVEQLQAATLRDWQTTLAAACTPQDNVTAAQEALRQQQGLPCLTHCATEALTPAHLQQLYSQLLRQRRRWRVLVTA